LAPASILARARSAAGDAAGGDDRQFAGNARANNRITAVDFSNSGAPDRPPASLARGEPSTPSSAKRGIGGDHGVDAVAAQGVGDVGDLVVVEVGRDLQASGT
jgi:hypothetical protein